MYTVSRNFRTKRERFLDFSGPKFRTKLPGHCTEREIELRGNSAMDRVKKEIIILKNRASEFKAQHEEIDNNVLQKIEIESTDPDVFTALKQLWVEDYETEEEKSLAIWNKKEKGLREVYDKEIRDKIDGLKTKQDEQEDSPTPIPQQRAQTNESGQNQRGRSPNNRNSSPTQPQYRSPQRNNFQDQRNYQNQINGYNTFGPAGRRGPSPQRWNDSFQGQHFSSNNRFTPRPPRRQGGTPVVPTGIDTIMEDTTTEVIERTITGETILTTSMDTEITISAVLMDTETTTSMDTGTLISIILMDTETAILEDTGTIILTTLMNTTSKEDSTVTKVMEIL